MSKGLQDEFDAITGVGGKHLAPKRPLDYVVSFLTLTLISAAIAGGGLLGLRIWDAGVIFTGTIADSAPAVPQVEITIVDGTNTGKATAIAEDLLAGGWNVLSALSLREIDPALPPAATTLIFISSEEFRPGAEALLEAFPEAAITVSEQFTSQVTVLIGTDYQG